MEIEKLIERLQNWDGIKPDREIDCAIEGLKALQAENDRLRRTDMERLTYDFSIGGNHCWQVKGADNLECREVCQIQGDKGCKDCPIAAAFDRLAAYEDTGLTPEEVQQMRWIPVEERLPEENVTVLAFNADPHAEKYVLARYRTVVYLGCYWCQFDQEYNSWCASCWKVTHWMPLPQPPKEVTHEK